MKIHNLMRTLLLILFVGLFSIACHAQGKWFLSTGVGLNTSKFELWVPVTNPTIMMGAKLWYMPGKHWQFGLSAETGKVQTHSTLVIVTTFENGNKFTSSNGKQQFEVLNPYVAPCLFAHYQVNFADKGHIYIGPAGGMVTGSVAGRRSPRRVNSYLAGADLGVAFPIAPQVQLTLNNSYRTTYLKLEAATKDVNQPMPTFREDYYYADQFVHYYNLSLGLAVEL